MSKHCLGFEKKLQWASGAGLVFILLIVAVVASGQGYFGTVSGLLTDRTGAVISGAKITLTDQEKGYKRSTTSDGSGRYLYRSVSPGLYTVVAEMPGFEKIERTNIRVNVGENPNADLSLKIAGSSETVEVKAQSQALDAEGRHDGPGREQKIYQRFAVGRSLRDGSCFADARSNGIRRPVRHKLYRDQLRLQWQPEFDRRRSDGWRNHNQL